MDLSALIFVALAVAWAVYLVPKALRYHEESAAVRSVDETSDQVRVVARREPVDATSARLVVTPGRPAPSVVAGPAPAEEGPVPAAPVREATLGRRESIRRATRRRRRVLGLILLAGVAVAVAAQLGHVPWAALAVPGGLLAGWLLLCRVLVRREQSSTRAVASRRPAPRRLPGPTIEDPETEEIHAVDVVDTVDADDADDRLVVELPDDAPDDSAGPVGDAATAGTAAAPVEVTPAEAPARSGGWDPVPVTLPTYVAKEPAARRSVRTIDLDSTGVWTSGRTDADAALAREADEADQAARSGRATRDAGGEADRRAAGS